MLLASASTVSASESRAVDEMLFTGDPRPERSTIAIWNRDISWTTARATPDMLDDIRAAAAEMNAVLNSSGIKLVEATGKTAALKITFVPAPQLAGVPGGRTAFRPGRIGNTFTFKKKDGSIRSAAIFIANNLPRGTRQYIIRHELMHAMGIPKHATYVFDSILRSNWEMSSAPRKLLDFDRKIIRFIYGHLKSGFSQAKTRRMFDRQWGKPAP